MLADDVSRAYALLGLRRGCSRRDVKQQYKRLVRVWHPDRFANDPVACAEATEQMRRINDAFATLQASVREAHVVRSPAEAAAALAREARPIVTQPLTADEIDELANAIGTPDPFRMRSILRPGSFPSSSACSSTPIEIPGR